MHSKTLWPLFQCHKQVRAMKLEDVRRSVDGTLHLVYCAGKYSEKACWSADSEFAKRCRAFEENDPGYIVEYPDGFISWSPTKAFEDGYSEVVDERDGSS